MAQFLAPLINTQQFDANGDPLSGGTIEVYLAGSSTPATTTSDQAGAVPNTWPIVLNTLGVNTQGAVWITGGASYKFVIKDSANVTLRTIDNISGINDTTVSVDQWVVYQAAPTYVSATSFTVAGDQTQTFQVKRRLKTTNTGGVVYSTISASAYSAPNTTVTVVNTSGALDSGLSSVSYGLISPQNSSVVGMLLNVQVLTASGTYTRTPGATSGLVRLVGGGAQGSGSAATAAGEVSLGAGGQSGAYGEHWYAGNLPASQAYTIGAGGSSGTAGTGGAAGGATTFGTLSAPGGGASPSPVLGTPPLMIGANTTTAPATGCNILNSTNEVGGFGIAISGGGFVSGGGAASPFGGGAAPNVTGSGAGQAAISRGAGGGGASGGASSAAFTGGVGGAGLIVVYEYT